MSVAARVVQALGARGGLVPGHAVARDGATLKQAARQLALLVMVTTASPAIYRLLGGLVATALGGCRIFDLLGAAGTGSCSDSDLAAGNQPPAGAAAQRVDAARHLWMPAAAASSPVARTIA
jgi:hypothetical protein